MVEKIISILSQLSEPSAYLLLLALLLLCGVGLPLPEDILLFAGGVSSYLGMTKIWLVILISYLGVIAGDSLMFFLGAFYGRKLTQHWPFSKLIPQERLIAMSGKLNKQGNRLIFIARFMPGLRAPIFFSAGTLHLPYRIFLLYDGLAALISIPAIVCTVHYFGDELEKVLHTIRKVEHRLFFIIIGMFVAIALKWYVTHRRIQKN
jgi:membrane protein DedA with SNARE-associated domain